MNDKIADKIPNTITVLSQKSTPCIPHITDNNFISPAPIPPIQNSGMNKTILKRIQIIPAPIPDIP